MKIYRTVLGDTWDLIAFKLYGNEYYMNQLLDANPKHLDTVIFEAGIVLNVPEISVPVSTKLPPWKR